jgi:hypothetical protein
MPVKLHGWMACITVAAAAALFGVVTGPDRAGASCIPIVVWHDTAYAGVGWDAADLPDVHTGRQLSGAVEPDCADTGGPAAAPTPVRAAAIDGVPTAVAIWAFGGPMVASGYFPRQPGFPFAPAGGAIDDETVGCRLGHAITVDGRAEAEFGGLAVVVSRSSERLRLTGGRVLTDLFLDSHTRIVGPSREGLPYIGGGQKVHVEARACQVQGAVGPKIVARRVVVSGPVPAPLSAAAILGADWAGSAGGSGRRLGMMLIAIASAAAVALMIRHRRAA